MFWNHEKSRFYVKQIKSPDRTRQLPRHHCSLSAPIDGTSAQNSGSNLTGLLGQGDGPHPYDILEMGG